jgi:hypothetical protein
VIQKHLLYLLFLNREQCHLHKPIFLYTCTSTISKGLKKYKAYNEWYLLILSLHNFCCTVSFICSHAIVYIWWTYAFGKNMRSSIQIKYYKIITSNAIIALYPTVEVTNIQTTCPKCIHKVQSLEKAQLNSVTIYTSICTFLT